MKIKQFSFSLDYSTINQKNKCHNNNKQQSEIIHTNKSTLCSPNLKTSSNKRLKYYSTRNKQTIAEIDQDNIQIFEEEFKRFHDANIKNSFNLKAIHKKDAFNLVAKKYYRNNKTNQNKQQKTIQKQENQKKIYQKLTIKKIKSHNLKNNTGFDGKYFRNYSRQSTKQLYKDTNKEIQITNSKQNEIGQFKGKASKENISNSRRQPSKQDSQFVLYPKKQKQNKAQLNQEPDNLTNTNLSFQNKSKYQHSVQRYLQKDSTIRNQNLSRQKMDIKKYFNSEIIQMSKRKNSAKKRVLVQQERLKRHIFNKSSISKFQNYDEYEKSLKNILNQPKPSNNHNRIQSDLQIVSPLQDIKSNIIYPNTVRTTKISKRYVSIDARNQSSTINVQTPTINPYTNRQYLHIKNKAQNQQLKTIQRIIKTSYSTNLIKSFHVKSITNERQNFNNQQSSQYKQKMIKQQFFAKEIHFPLNKIFKRNKKSSKTIQDHRNLYKNGINAWQNQNQQFYKQSEEYQHII